MIETALGAWETGSSRRDAETTFGISSHRSSSGASVEGVSGWLGAPALVSVAEAPFAGDVPVAAAAEAVGEGAAAGAEAVGGGAAADTSDGHGHTTHRKRTRTSQRRKCFIPVASHPLRASLVTGLSSMPSSIKDEHLKEESGIRGVPPGVRPLSRRKVRTLVVSGPGAGVWACRQGRRRRNGVFNIGNAGRGSQGAPKKVSESAGVVHQAAAE